MVDLWGSGDYHHYSDATIGALRARSNNRLALRRRSRQVAFRGAVVGSSGPAPV